MTASFVIARSAATKQSPSDKAEIGTKSAAATPLTQKLARLVPLSAADAAVIDALQAPTRMVARHRELITAGAKYDGLLILIGGLALRSRVLHDGRRQILNIAIPGDVIGFPAC